MIPLPNRAYALRRRMRPVVNYIRRPPTIGFAIQDWWYRARVGFKAVPPTGEAPIEWNGKHTIWMAWTGDNPVPGYLELCLESVRKYNVETCNVIVITPSNLHEYFPEVHPAYPYLSYVHRADYIRCQALHNYGGMYLDMDTICFRPLHRWWSVLDAHDFAGYDGRPSCELFGVSVLGPARRNSVFTRAWIAEVHKVLDRRLTDLVAFRKTNRDPTQDCLGWADILGNVVTPLSKQLATNRCLSLHRISRQYFSLAADLFTNAELFGSKELRIGPSVYLLIMNNENYPAIFKSQGREQIIQSNCGLAGLVRQALR